MISAIRAICIFILLCLWPAISYGRPVLFFSDLDSGPSTGNGDTSRGQVVDENGVLVSVWGKNLGEAQGGSQVIIGGKTAGVIYYWGNAASLEKAGGAYAKSLHDSHRMQKITFQVPAGADNSGINVIVDGENSNILPFAIRPGNIYFVDDDSPNYPGSGTYADPWRSPADYISALAGQDGAICYFRQGDYSNTEYAGVSLSNKSCFRLNQDAAGTDGANNAFVGYPNEIASFGATAGIDKNDPDYFMYVFSEYPYNSATNITVSSLRLESNTVVAKVLSKWRFTGNLCIGGDIFNQGTGILITGSHVSHVTYPERYVQGWKICGNVIAGERTANKLNHAVYFGAGSDNDFGWNYVYGNNVAEGPLLSCNLEDSKENGYLPLANTALHDNVVDMSEFPSRAIGVHELALNSD